MRALSFTVSLFILVIMTGCATEAERTAALPKPVATASQTATPAEAIGAGGKPAPTDTATPTDTPAPSPTPQPPTPSPQPPIAADLSLSAGSVFVYPVPALYDGDQATFQVQADVPEGIAPPDVEVAVLVDGEQLLNGTLGWRNLAGNAVGLYEWVWNTTGLTGEHQLEFVLDPRDTISQGDENPDNNRAVLTVEVRAAGWRPLAERDATWVTAETACCTVHVVSDTAARRDLNALTRLMESAAQQASNRLNEPLQGKIDVYFIDRVIGQGGYAGSVMVISYLDRDYAGGGLYEVLVHEATHIIDQQFAPNRISFLAEGVAVWATGGHYKQEDLDQRVASLLRIGRYVPLESAINNFYPTQHEIGYAQAGGFVHYLVDQYGWEAVRPFYSDMTADDAPTLAGAVDVNLQQHFGKTLAQVEGEWLAYLEALPRDSTAVTDLETTLRFYETMRAYQQHYDPSAYFLYAWLPSPEQAEERGITADFTRHPQSQLNMTLETMLHAADAALRGGEYERATVLLESVERVIANHGAFLDPLGMSYRSLVQTAVNLGYVPQQITLEGNQAAVVATEPAGVVLTELTLALENQAWHLTR